MREFFCWKCRNYTSTREGYCCPDCSNDLENAIKEMEDDQTIAKLDKIIELLEKLVYLAI